MSVGGWLGGAALHRRPYGHRRLQLDVRNLLAPPPLLQTHVQDIVPQLPPSTPEHPMSTEYPEHPEHPMNTEHPEYPEYTEYTEYTEYPMNTER